jgi:hypothetical protein
MEEKSKESIKKTKTQEEQIQKLQNFSEENFMEIKKINGKIDKIKYSQEVLIEKFDETERNTIRINNEILRIKEIEYSLDNNKNRIDSFYKDYQDFEYFTNKKFSDNESNILNLVAKVSEFNQQIKSNNINNTNEYNVNHINNDIKNKESNNINSHLSYLQILKPEDNLSLSIMKKDIESLKKANKEFNEKLEKFSNVDSAYDNLIIDLNKQINESNILTNKNLEILSENFYKKLDEELAKKEDKNINFEDSYKLKSQQQIEIIYDQLLKIQDSIKSNTIMLDSKISKDDADKISRICKLDIEKISLKLSEFNKENDSKINKITEKYLDFNNQLIKISQKLNSENMEDGVENFNNIFNKIGNRKLDGQISCFFEELVKNKIVEFFSVLTSEDDNINENCNENNKFFSFYSNNSNNIIFSIEEIPFFEKLIKKIQENKNDIVSLSNIVGEKNKEKEIYTNKLESRFNLLIDKLNELDDSFSVNKIKNEERFRNIEGDFDFMDDFDLQNLLYPNMNVFNAIKFNMINSNKDSKRIDKIIYDLKNLNNDLLNKLKKDLNNESLKILGDFKSDLKISILKIEDQLKEKVDLFSLDEFGKKVDSKLNNEFNKKLDRQDLMKNNNIINKKIDFLESKISKTLVDTLIDLQMEDTPLIIKKSMTGNCNKKCASCNQNIIIEKNVNSIMEDENRNTCNSVSSINNNNNNLTKYKFRSIQDNSNKYGTGSYSRHLSNIENEDLRGERKIFNYQLPNIPEKNIRSSIKKNNNNSHQSFRNTFHKLKINEATERRFNSMINEELEKSIVNPDNFIRTANKIHDNAEKIMIFKDIIDK